MIDKSLIGVQSDSMKKLPSVSSVIALSAALLVFSFVLLAESRLDPAISFSKRELIKTLKARGDKSLPELAAKFVAAHGAELTRATLLALWADEAHGAPLSRTGDTLWLLGQPQLLKDTAWLLHFEGDWAPQPRIVLPPMPPSPPPLPTADELPRPVLPHISITEIVLLPTARRTNDNGQVDLLFALPGDWNSGYVIQRREPADALWQYVASLDWSKGGATDAIALQPTNTAQFRLVKR